MTAKIFVYFSLQCSAVELECSDDEYPCTLHGFTYFCCKCNDRDTYALNSGCRLGVDAVVYKPLHPICCTRYDSATTGTTSVIIPSTKNSNKCFLIDIFTISPKFTMYYVFIIFFL